MTLTARTLVVGPAIGLVVVLAACQADDAATPVPVDDGAELAHEASHEDGPPDDMELESLEEAPEEAQEAVPHTTGTVTVYDLRAEYSVDVSWEIFLDDVGTNIADARPGEVRLEPQYRGTVTVTNTTPDRNNSVVLASGDVGLMLSWPAEDLSHATGEPCELDGTDLRVDDGTVEHCPAIVVWSNELGRDGILRLAPDEAVTVGIDPGSQLRRPLLTVTEDDEVQAQAIAVLSGRPSLVVISDRFTAADGSSLLMPRCFFGDQHGGLNVKREALAVSTDDGRQLGPTAVPEPGGSGRSLHCSDYVRP